MSRRTNLTPKASAREDKSDFNSTLKLKDASVTKRAPSGGSRSVSRNDRINGRGDGQERVVTRDGKVSNQSKYASSSKLKTPVAVQKVDQSQGMTPVAEASAPRALRSADLEHVTDENEARNDQSAKAVQTSAPRDPRQADTISSA